MQELIKELNGLCDKEPFRTTWFFKDLKSGEVADRQGDLVVSSASTRKISILMAALKAVNDGRFSLDQKVVMREEYQKNNSGTFQHLTPGFSITFRDAMVMMIIVSDNTCTGTVADMVGIDEINRYCKGIGMKATHHKYGLPPQGNPDVIDLGTETTANDSGLILDLILKGTEDASVAKSLGCTKDLCKLALDILSWQKLNTRLPSLLPARTIVAHKTGTGAHVYNDAGIIYKGAEPRFILAVYTSDVPVEMPSGLPGFAAAARLMGTLARTAYDALA